MGEFTRSIEDGLELDDFAARKQRLQQMLLQMGGFNAPPIPEAPKPKPAPKKAAPPPAAPPQPRSLGIGVGELTDVLTGSWLSKNAPVVAPADKPVTNIDILNTPRGSANLIRPIVPYEQKPETREESIRRQLGEGTDTLQRQVIPTSPVESTSIGLPPITLRARKAAEQEKDTLNLVDRATNKYLSTHAGPGLNPYTKEALNSGVQSLIAEEQGFDELAYKQYQEKKKLYDELIGQSLGEAPKTSREAAQAEYIKRTGDLNAPKAYANISEFLVDQPHLEAMKSLQNEYPHLAQFVAPFQGNDVTRGIGHTFFSALNSAAFGTLAGVDEDKWRKIMGALDAGTWGNPISEAAGGLIGFTKALPVLKATGELAGSGLGAVKRSLSATGAAETLANESLLARFGAAIPEKFKEAAKLGTLLSSYSIPNKIIEVGTGKKDPVIAGAELLTDFVTGTLAGGSKDVALGLVRNSLASPQGKLRLAQAYNGVGQVVAGAAQQLAYSKLNDQPFDIPTALVNVAQNFILTIPEAEALSHGVEKQDLAQLKSAFDNAKSMSAAYEAANTHQWERDSANDSYYHQAEDGSRVYADDSVNDILRTRAEGITNVSVDKPVETGDLGAAGLQRDEGRVTGQREAVAGETEGVAPQGEVRSAEAREPAQTERAQPRPVPGKGEVIETDAKVKRYVRQPGEPLVTYEDRKGGTRRGVVIRATGTEARAIDRYAVPVPGRGKGKAKDANYWFIDERHTQAPEGETAPTTMTLEDFKGQENVRIAEAMRGEAKKLGVLPVTDQTSFTKALAEVMPHLPKEQVDDLGVVAEALNKGMQSIYGGDYNFYDRFSLTAQEHGGVALQQAAGMPPPPKLEQGSAALFDLFHRGKIGSGEGTQFEGVGHYFTSHFADIPAEEFSTPGYYADQAYANQDLFTPASDIIYKGKRLDHAEDGTDPLDMTYEGAADNKAEHSAVQAMIYAAGNDNVFLMTHEKPNTGDAIPPDMVSGASLKYSFDRMKAQAKEYIESGGWDLSERETQQALNTLEDMKSEDFQFAGGDPSPRVIYTVKLKGNFVPYSHEAAELMGAKTGNPEGTTEYKKLEQVVSDALDEDVDLKSMVDEFRKPAAGVKLEGPMKWSDVYWAVARAIETQPEPIPGIGAKSGAEAASDLFLRAGIDGVAYVDGNSASYLNYVAYGDKNIDILDKFLYQAPGEESMSPKGLVRFLEDGKAVIHALGKSDVSTVIHELSHVARRNLDEQSLNVLADAYGLKDGNWTVEAEEKFARGFEKYMRNGVVPDDPGLLAVFKRVATYMKEVYQTIKGTPLEGRIPEGVKAVFEELVGDRAAGRERVLALNEKIASAKTLREAMTLGDAAAPDILTAEYPALTDAVINYDEAGLPPESLYQEGGNDAVTQGLKQGDNIPEHQGVQDGGNLREDEGQVRKEESGRAGGGRGALGGTQKQKTPDTVAHMIRKEASQLEQAATPKSSDIPKLEGEDAIYSDPKVLESIRNADIATGGIKPKPGIKSMVGDILRSVTRVFAEMPKKGELAQEYFGLMKAMKGAGIAKDHISRKMLQIADTLKDPENPVITAENNGLYKAYRLISNEIENREYGHIAQITDDLVAHMNEHGEIESFLPEDFLEKNGMTAPRDLSDLRQIARPIAAKLIETGEFTPIADSVPLHFKWKDATLDADWAAIQKKVAANPQVREAILQQKALHDEVADTYSKLYEEVTGNKANFNREDYLHQRTLAYLLADPVRQGLPGATGSRSSRYRQRRGEEAYDFSTNIWEADYHAMSSLMADSKFYEFIAGEYDRTSKPILQKLYDGEIESIPEGYRRWMPPYGSKVMRPFNPDIIAESGVNLELLDALQNKALESITGGRISMNDLKEGGGIFDKFIIKNELADAMTSVFQGAKPSESTLAPLKDLYRKGFSAWKWWSLNSPTRAIKTFTRNLLGDADKIAINPDVLRHTGKALSELKEYIYNGTDPGPELQMWIDRGGANAIFNLIEDIGYSDTQKLVGEAIGATSPINTVNDYTNIWEKAVSAAKTAGKGYFRTVNNISTLRESVLRYANFLSYKKQMDEGGGIPNNYGSSNPEYINNLASNEDRAWDLSNRLMGAYDETTEAGRWLARNLIPFWRFRETNLKTYWGALANTWREPANARLLMRLGPEAIGKTAWDKVMTTAKISGMPIAAFLYKFGKFIVATNALSAIYEAINYTQKDRVKDLSDKSRKESYVLLGGNEQETFSFNRLSTFTDFLEMFGLTDVRSDVRDVVFGFKTLAQVIEEWVSTPQVAAERAKGMLASSSNYWLQGMGWPSLAAGYTPGYRKSLYPDFWNPRPVRDSWEPLMSFLGMNEYYRAAVTDLPDNMNDPMDFVNSLLIYRLDHEKANYDKMMDKAIKYGQAHGSTFGPKDAYSDKQNAMFYMRQGVRYGDYPAVVRNLEKWARLQLKDPSYTLDKPIPEEVDGEEAYDKLAESLAASFKSLDPLTFVPTGHRDAFLSEMSEEDKSSYDRAKKFINQLMTNESLYDELKRAAKENSVPWEELLRSVGTVESDELPTQEEIDDAKEKKRRALPIPGNYPTGN